MTTPSGGELITPAEEPTVAAGDPPAARDAAAIRRSGEGVTRYLVVPERIALQADAGFAEPPPAPASVRPTVPPRAAVQNLPPVRQGVATPSRPATAGQRSARQSRPPARPQPAQQNRPQQQPPQRRPTTPPAARQATAAGPRGLGAMFPGIAAGIDAMTGGGRRPREAADGYDQAIATDDPTFTP